jgi:hypothetical protein
MRLWVHQIWRDKNDCICQTMGPRDDKPFEELIRQYDERIVKLAWALYVYSDPPAYHLEPVETVEAYTSPKTGRTSHNRFEDASAITKFPLAAFRAVSEAYIVEALLLIEDLEKAKAAGGNLLRTLPDAKLIAVQAVTKKRDHTSVKPSWGLNLDEDEQDTE